MTDATDEETQDAVMEAEENAWSDCSETHSESMTLDCSKILKLLKSEDTYDQSIALSGLSQIVANDNAAISEVAETTEILPLLIEKFLSRPLEITNGCIPELLSYAIQSTLKILESSDINHDCFMKSGENRKILGNLLKSGQLSNVKNRVQIYAIIQSLCVGSGLSLMDSDLNFQFKVPTSTSEDTLAYLKVMNSSDTEEGNLFKHCLLQYWENGATSILNEISAIASSQTQSFYIRNEAYLFLCQLCEWVTFPNSDDCGESAAHIFFTEQNKSKSTDSDADSTNAVFIWDTYNQQFWPFVAQVLKPENREKIQKSLADFNKQLSDFSAELGDKEVKLGDDLEAMTEKWNDTINGITNDIISVTDMLCIVDMVLINQRMNKDISLATIRQYLLNPLTIWMKQSLSVFEIVPNIQKYESATQPPEECDFTVSNTVDGDLLLNMLDRSTHGLANSTSNTYCETIQRFEKELPGSLKDAAWNEIFGLDLQSIFDKWKRAEARSDSEEEEKCDGMEVLDNIEIIMHKQDFLVKLVLVFETLHSIASQFDKDAEIKGKDLETLLSLHDQLSAENDLIHEHTTLNKLLAVLVSRHLIPTNYNSEDVLRRLLGDCKVSDSGDGNDNIFLAVSACEELLSICEVDESVEQNPIVKTAIDRLIPELEKYLDTTAEKIKRQTEENKIKIADGTNEDDLEFDGLDEDLENYDMIRDCLQNARAFVR